MKSIKIAATAACLCLWSAVAHAHPNHITPSDSGLVAGLAHPLLGIDHLVAIFAVGLLSAQLGGRSSWFVPTAFLASMLAGCAGGTLGWTLPAVEYGIALSVVLLGLAIVLNQKYPLAIPLTAVAMFGLFHGHAHGTEMPQLANGVQYAIGFVATTSLLLVAGLMLGRWAIGSTQGTTALRLSGGAIAAVGVCFLLRHL